LLTLAIVIAVVDEGVRMYRGWRNTHWATVPGYGIYEKQYSSPVVDEHMQKVREKSPLGPYFPPRGWELLDFYQWEMPCRFYTSQKQRAWTQENQDSRAAWSRRQWSSALHGIRSAGRKIPLRANENAVPARPGMGLVLDNDCSCAAARHKRGRFDQMMTVERVVSLPPRHHRPARAEGTLMA
jgi:hypothetical protein